MNKPAKITGAILIICICILLGSCEKKQVPVLETSEISNITGTTATSGGKITDEGSGTIISRGICWSTSTSPTIEDSKTSDGAGAGSFTSNLVDLNVATKYYVRAYATNNVGTGYGMAISFNTDEVVIDTDGNEYPMVTIGTQVWMAENLKTTKNNDGSQIFLITDNTAWGQMSAPGYCWYNNDISNKNPYGALYNWYAANKTTLCPVGWHVPSNAEWTTLITFLGGENIAGGKMKETNTTHWISSNEGVTNSSGFTALPGGERSTSGTFSDLGNYGSWWAVDVDGYERRWRMTYYDNTAKVYVSGGLQERGIAIRCIRN